MPAASIRVQLLVVISSLILATWVTAAQTRTKPAARPDAPSPSSIGFRDLGLIGSGFLTHGAAVNNRGHVAGRGLSSTLTLVAFLWTPELGFQLILGDTPGEALDLNDRDEVVGTFGNEDDIHGFLWTRKTGVIDLGSEFRPRAINNRRQIAGVCVETDGTREFYPACLWENGVVTRLNIGLGVSDEITGINARGDVVGYSDLGWVWTARTGPMTLPLTFPQGINNRGQIVAWDVDPMFRAICAVLSKDGSFIRQAPSDTFFPRAINARGWVVGSVEQAASIWYPNGAIVTLPGAIPFSEANDINERGQITGWAQAPDGSVHAILWTARGVPKE